ncbi:MAG: 3-hydroxybenzoate 6-monooxygenase [Rhodospirillaceae bacterium]|nr:3-hydroxybenzoate 6-monooxygenase [Rhodospirillaceae bacterium]
MAQKTVPVLIVGGGIGGLGAALALALQGIPSRVLEQASGFGEIGAGIQLGPNVFRMFHRLGISDAIEKRAVFVDKIIMMDAVAGTPITEVPLGKPFRERFGQPYAVIHRADLHRALLDACEARGELISLETKTSVTSVRDTDDGVVAVTGDGSEISGAALIGADGLWSSVRAYVADDGPPRVSGHVAYRAVLPMEQVPKEMRWNAATLWAGPRIHLVHYPLRNGELMNLVAVFHSDRYVEGWNAPGEVDELLRWFKDIDPRPLSLIDLVSEWRMWVLCDRDPISKWSRGRTTLLGDAAHPMLQYFAQGACMALEDAVCLADKVTAADGDYGEAFKAYQAERYLRTGRVQLMARFLGDIYHAKDVERELRNQMLAGRTPETSYQGLAWLYDGP